MKGSLMKLNHVSTFSGEGQMIINKNDPSENEHLGLNWLIVFQGIKNTSTQMFSDVTRLRSEIHTKSC